MKKLLLLILFCQSSAFGQSFVSASYPGGSDIIATIDAYFFPKDLKKGKIYLLNFGDGEQFVVKNTDAIRHTYTAAGNYVVKLLEITDSGENKMAAIDNVEVLPAPTKIIFTHLALLKFNPVKPSGAAWDNTWGGNYPDVVVFMYSGDKALLNTPTKQNIKDKFIDDSRYSILLSEIQERFAIIFYDEDSVSSYDQIIGFELPISIPELFEYQKNGIHVEMDGCIVDIKIKLE